jgi:hypothetical protein
MAGRNLWYAVVGSKASAENIPLWSHTNVRAAQNGNRAFAWRNAIKFVITPSGGSGPVALKLKVKPRFSASRRYCEGLPLMADNLCLFSGKWFCKTQ